jgi:predicted AlkP superfamily phosphohydrolase/phosphomutase
MRPIRAPGVLLPRWVYLPAALGVIFVALPLVGIVANVDWSRTKAYPQGTGGIVGTQRISLNVRGREPEGIVEPGEEYEAVRDAVIEAFYNYTDPGTGKKPILFALRKEDARVLGLYGDNVGDIVWCLRPEFGGQHGNFLPTVEWGMGSLRGLFIMAGPGVKRGVTLDRNVWLTDIVPTICHLTDWPVPRDAEGGILYQALDDPDAKSKELERLRESCRRFEQAFSGEKRLTHTYNE